MERICVYAGSFDPVTVGHEDIIRRAAKLCDQLLVTVMYNPAKTGCFSVAQRLEMLERVTADIPNVQVDAWDEVVIIDATRSTGKVSQRTENVAERLGELGQLLQIIVLSHILEQHNGVPIHIDQHIPILQRRNVLEQIIGTLAVRLNNVEHQHAALEISRQLMLMAEGFQLTTGQFTTQRTTVHIEAILRVRIIHAAEGCDKLAGQLQNIVGAGSIAAKYDPCFGDGKILAAVILPNNAFLDLVKALRE